MGSFACMYIGAMLLQFQNRPEECAGSFGTGVTDTSGLGCDQNQYGSSAGINVLNPELHYGIYSKKQNQNLCLLFLLMTTQEISKRILRKQGFVMIREVVMDEGSEDIFSFIPMTTAIYISDIKQCPAKFCEHKNV